MSRWLLYAVAGTLLGFWPWWIHFLPLTEVGKARPAARPQVKDLLNESFDSRPCGYPPSQPKVIDQPSHLAPERVMGAIR